MQLSGLEEATAGVRRLRLVAGLLAEAGQEKDAAYFVRVLNSLIGLGWVGGGGNAGEC